MSTFLLTTQNYKSVSSRDPKSTGSALSRGKAKPSKAPMSHNHITDRIKRCIRYRKTKPHLYFVGHLQFQFSFSLLHLTSQPTDHQYASITQSQIPEERRKARRLLLPSVLLWRYPTTPPRLFVKYFSVFLLLNFSIASDCKILYVLNLRAFMLKAVM